MIRQVARELDDAIRRGRVRSLLLDRAAPAVVLYLRDRTLAFHLTPGDPRISLGDPVDPPPESRPLASEVMAVDSVADERILRVVLRRVRGKAEDPELVLEMAGNRPNAVLVGRASGRILSVLRPVEGQRTLAPGLPYPTMPPSSRLGVEGDLDRDQWRHLVQGEDGEPSRNLLLRSVAWSSALNAPLLLDGESGYETWEQLVRGPDLAPGRLRADGSSQPYIVPLPGGDWTPTHSLLEAAEESSEAPYVPASAVAALEARVESQRRALKAMERQLENAPDPEVLRGHGDLVLARLGQIPRGSGTVTLQDFDGSSVTLELDAALEPAENARRFYDAAGRAKRAREDLPARIHEARERLSLEERRVEAALRGELDEDELADLTSGITDRSGSRSSTPAPLPYRRFRTSGGLEVRVGKGARSNDDLTFRHSRPMDVWLHARSVGGAHVILRWDREQRPPARDLEEAAALAALHSKARTSGSVPVDWTRRKHVRKPRKAKAGAVLPAQVDTVFVDPDPELLDRLRWED